MSTTETKITPPNNHGSSSLIVINNATDAVADADAAAAAAAADTAIVLCTSPLVQQLTQARIPPNYIGTRRVAVSRPPPPSNGSNNSNHGNELLPPAPAEQDGTAVVGASSSTQSMQSSSVVFKVTEPDGTERRMTRQEKKALRQKLAQEKKEAKQTAKKEGKQRRQQQEQIKKRKLEEMDPKDDKESNDDETSTQQHDADDNIQQEPVLANSVNRITDGTATPKYHQLSVSTTAMEEELAEFRAGDRRDGLPPVMLSPPMALCAFDSLVFPSSSNEIPQQLPSRNTKNNWIQYDPVLSEQWARELKASMLPAEIVRQGEDLRPMAYQLTPESWTRMRPEGNLEEKFKTKVDSSVFEQGVTGNAATSTMGTNDWLTATCRPTSPLDVAVAVVFDFLYQTTPLHVSCGAKFGSDFLIYDGPRNERHAFAGMRVLLPTRKNEDGSSLPLPSAYDMAGYVRCLNTAGKLALLATVIEEPLEAVETAREQESSSSPPTSLYRVAIVDMALEKILSAPTHQKHARTQKRRDISRNLAKRK